MGSYHGSAAGLSTSDTVGWMQAAIIQLRLDVSRSLSSEAKVVEKGVNGMRW